MTEISLRTLKFAILACLDWRPQGNKPSMLGMLVARGELETDLNCNFSDDDRARAVRAFAELERDELIQPTFEGYPEQNGWVRITKAGKLALTRGALDDLDRRLSEIDPHLVEIREGAWAAVWSAKADALRQAAHSGRELIDQTLRALAPDEKVKSEEGFKPNPDSRNGVTRRHRIRYAIRQRHGRMSDTDAAIVEAACDMMLKIQDKMMALAHAREMPDRKDVEDSLSVAEIALRRVVG